jgi:hypothetical protein
MFVGFFNTGINSKAAILGMLIEEPSGTVNDGFRLSTSVNDMQGQPKKPIGFQSTPLEFSLTWDANPSGDGSGTLSGTVTSQAGPVDLSPVTVGPNALRYNAFGVGAGGVDGGDPTVQLIGYFDDLTYSIIPEPGALTLIGLGIGLMLLRRKRS